MFDDFLVRALVAGIGIALIAGPLGCFVVWRRMAYFGDSLAHGALLGIALGFLLDVDLLIGMVASCVLAGLLLVGLERRRTVAADTLLGILAHGGLALGLVVLTLVPNVRVDLNAYLFGDLLAVTKADLIWIWLGGAVIIGLLVRFWSRLVFATVHEDLARAEGLPATRLRLILVLMMAVTVAVAMKIVGVLLVTALLIIPAASVRRFAATPEIMAVLASLAGALSVTLGLLLSVRIDTPSGPSIVVAALLLFVLSLVPWPSIDLRCDSDKT